MFRLLCSGELTPCCCVVQDTEKVVWIIQFSEGAARHLLVIQHVGNADLQLGGSNTGMLPQQQDAMCSPAVGLSCRSDRPPSSLGLSLSRAPSHTPIFATPAARLETEGDFDKEAREIHVPHTLLFSRPTHYPTLGESYRLGV